MTIDVAQVPVAEAPPTRPPHPGVIASRWGNCGALLGGGLVLLVALPLRPGPDAGPWDDLVWTILAVAAGIVLGIIGGTIGTFWGLRRNGLPYAATTSLVYIPVATVCAGLTAGVGALVAPALAWWLVDGVRGGRFKPRPPLYYGSPEALAEDARSRRRRSLAPRLAITVVLCAGATSWVLNYFGYQLGGELHGELFVWATCLPALVVVPVVLLRGRLRTRCLIAGIVAAVLGAGSLVPSAASSAPPSGARLERLALDLPGPPGQHVAEHHSALGVDLPGGEPAPITILTSVPEGSVPPDLPSALTPQSDGRLPEDWSTQLQTGEPLKASEEGEQAADLWEEALPDGDWRVDRFTTAEYGNPIGPPWGSGLAGATQAPHRATYANWTGVRVTVFPYYDGALVVVTVR